METINTMANAATKAIWGTNEANEEPVSGATGNTSKGEPYDAGNIDDPQHKANVAEAQTKSESTTAAPTVASPATDDPLEHKEKIGKPELKSQSAENAPPSDSAAGKTDTRHPADPATDPAPKGQDVSTESGTGPTNNGDKLDGPGPRPLESVAKERGGDAGNVSKNDSSHSGLAASGPGEKEDDEDGPQKKSQGEGTGEKYVKSTGLAADGGDFDATKPGAGREADRLLEEKDPAAAAAAAKAAKPSSSSSNNGEQSHGSNDGTEKEKKSLGDKIKAKLHRH